MDKPKTSPIPRLNPAFQKVIGDKTGIRMAARAQYTSFIPSFDLLKSMGCSNRRFWKLLRFHYPPTLQEVVGFCIFYDVPLKEVVPEIPNKILNND